MLQDMFSLQDKVIVITGASSGLGRQTAIDCSRQGAIVALVARNREALEATRAQMDTPERHLVLPADVTDPGAAKTVIETVRETLGPIAGFVHSAGISDLIPLGSAKQETMDRFFHINVYAALELTRELCRRRNMVAEGASVVWIASVMGCVGEAAKSLYSATKGALIASARSLAVELASKKVRVNCVSPGAVLTSINAELPYMKDPERRAALEAQHPLGLGTPADISAACIYLLSPAARWVTGQNLVVDGGYTSH